VTPSRGSGSAAPFPWDEVLAFGLGVLRFSPDCFWRMTPRELSHAVRGVRGVPAAPLSRGAFVELMKRFPDG
jgi:uncharacterized phage protein (TIGR02216 family)